MPLSTLPLPPQSPKPPALAAFPLTGLKAIPVRPTHSGAKTELPQAICLQIAALR
jgi:hypothetical protein